MRNDTISKVLYYLMDVTQITESGTIKIKRDDIISIISKKISGTEEELYELFLKKLNKEFGLRFFYSMRDDNYLWLNTLHDENNNSPDIVWN